MDIYIAKYIYLGPFRVGTQILVIRPNVRLGTQILVIRPNVRLGTQIFVIRPNVFLGAQILVLGPNFRLGTHILVRLLVHYLAGLDAAQILVRPHTRSCHGRPIHSLDLGWTLFSLSQWQAYTLPGLG